MRILDTDHCVAILRGQLDLRQHLLPEEELATTAISVADLTHGTHRSQRRDDNLASLEVLLAALTVLPFDESAARRFGFMKADPEVAGEPLHDLDLQIASIALDNNFPLLTGNIKHFKRIQRLQLQNWLS